MNVASLRLFHISAGNGKKTVRFASETEEAGRRPCPVLEPTNAKEPSCPKPRTPRAETVAASGPAPYTAGMVIGPPGSVPWWKEAVRSWVPVLGIAAVLVFQMVTLQQQIGDLRTDLHREIGGLRTDFQREIGTLRTEMGERITRLETLLESRAAR